MARGNIRDNVHRILDELGPNVKLVAAVKGRTAAEVEEAIQAGVTVIGHNYVQEAEAMRAQVGEEAEWHMIGHLQRNKAKTAVAIFDMIETLDSARLARALDRRGAAIDAVIPALIEVNSGRESSKTGVLPQGLDELVRVVSELENVQIEGLMTMGPRFGDPEDSRPYFRITRESFERLAGDAPAGVRMRVLSMGMSNSWRQAVQEGSNMVRIGTEIFGARPTA